MLLTDVCQCLERLLSERGVTPFTYRRSKCFFSPLLLDGDTSFSSFSASARFSMESNSPLAVRHRKSYHPILSRGVRHRSYRSKLRGIRPGVTKRPCPLSWACSIFFEYALCCGFVTCKAVRFRLHGLPSVSPYLPMLLTQRGVSIMRSGVSEDGILSADFRPSDRCLDCLRHERRDNRAQPSARDRLDSHPPEMVGELIKQLLPRSFRKKKVYITM